MPEPLTRRRAVQLLTGAVIAGPEVARGAEKVPGQTAGPFYPLAKVRGVEAGIPLANDLCSVPGAAGLAMGKRLFITGRVSTEDDRRVPGVQVEIWQACASGGYLHPGDHRNHRRLDPNFQFWGSCQAGDDGAYAFKTILPPAYPSGLPGWIRPPHIHVRVVLPGRLDFITQLYFDDPEDPLRDANSALQRKDRVLGGLDAGTWNRVIRPVYPVAEGLAGPLVAAGLKVPSLGEVEQYGAGSLDFPLVLGTDTYLP